MRGVNVMMVVLERVPAVHIERQYIKFIYF